MLKTFETPEGVIVPEACGCDELLTQLFAIHALDKLRESHHEGVAHAMALIDTGSIEEDAEIIIVGFGDQQHPPEAASLHYFLRRAGRTIDFMDTAREELCDRAEAYVAGCTGETIGELDVIDGQLVCQGICHSPQRETPVEIA